MDDEHHLPGSTAASSSAMPSSALTLSPLAPVQADDLQVCLELLQKGSRSFHAASLLLPTRVRHDAAAIYAFCRVADDAVDLGTDPLAALTLLRQRLTRLYDSPQLEDPVDRAFRRVTQAHRIPRAVPEALLEGFEWDVRGRPYHSLDDVVAYGVRVASTVGLMMSMIMGVRSPAVLARACDLGIAMQLTNICRDVGEDAQNGRVYLPALWLREEGIDPASLLGTPHFTPALGRVVKRLMAVAERYYQRSSQGLPFLPWTGRVAIRAAGLIYADIHRVIEASAYDSVSSRAYTSGARKLWLALTAFPVLFWSRVPPSSQVSPAALPLLQACEWEDPSQLQTLEPVPELDVRA